MNYTVSPERIDFYDERWYRRKIGDCILPKQGMIIEGYKYLPSVTTYLESYPKGYGYEEWLKNTKEPEKVRDIAGEKGTLVHQNIESLLKVGWVEYDPFAPLEVWEKTNYFWDWYRESGIKAKPHNVEIMLFDERIETAGTVDLICSFNGEKTVFDWKTGGLYASSEIQVATYAKLIGADKAFILQLDKKLNKKGWRMTEITDIEEKFELFLATQKIWRNEHKNAKPKLTYLPTLLGVKNEDLS